jgi:hypothetical protein
MEPRVRLGDGKNWWGGTESRQVVRVQPHRLSHGGRDRLGRPLLIDGPSPDGVRPKTTSLSCSVAAAEVEAAGAGDMEAAAVVVDSLGAWAVRDLWVCWPMVSVRERESEPGEGCEEGKASSRPVPAQMAAAAPARPNGFSPARCTPRTPHSVFPLDNHLPPGLMSFAFPLSTTGALSFNDHLIAPEQDLALRLDQATTARAGLRGVLKDDKRTADGQRDPNAIVAVRRDPALRRGETGLTASCAVLPSRPSRTTCPFSARSSARSSRTTSSSAQSPVRRYLRVDC